MPREQDSAILPGVLPLLTYAYHFVCELQVFTAASQAA